MITVRISDKRYYKGFRIKFFHSDVITPEIYAFVKDNKKAYWVDGKGILYTEREAFLKDYVSLDKNK